MQPIVKIFLINSKGEFLLQLRAKEDTYGGRWSLFGGGVEAGETYEQALVREIKEEIGYDLREYELMHQDEDGGVPRAWYQGPMDKELHELVLGEGDDFGFFGYEQAIQLDLTPSTKRLLQHLFSERS